MPPWLLPLLTAGAFAGSIVTAAVTVFGWRAQRRLLAHQAKLTEDVQRRTRLEDAYAELFGAVQLMLRLSFGSLASSRDPKEDEAWVRFGTARACVLLQEKDRDRQHWIMRLEVAMEHLYTTKVYLDGEPSDEQKFDDGQEHLSKMYMVKHNMDVLIRMLRGEPPPDPAGFVGHTIITHDEPEPEAPDQLEQEAAPEQLQPVAPTDGKGDA